MYCVAILSPVPWNQKMMREKKETDALYTMFWRVFFFFIRRYALWQTGWSYYYVCLNISTHQKLCQNYMYLWVFIHYPTPLKKDSMLISYNISEASDFWDMYCDYWNLHWCKWKSWCSHFHPFKGSNGWWVCMKETFCSYCSFAIL